MMVVIMGVAGAGKTAVGQALAAARGWPFLEGDDLHPPANVAKMAAGHPLEDADRTPWLDAIATWMAGRADGVVACSALKHAYRDRLRAAAADARFVLLNPPRDVLARRLAARRGHFMPASLLASQLATLEMPGADEHALVVPESETIGAAVACIIQWLD